MSKKLTLRLDEDVIEQAKVYAAERGTSVSKLVEDYFRALQTADGNETDFEAATLPVHTPSELLTILDLRTE